MSALQDNEAIEPPTADPVLECLEDLLDKLAAAVTEGPPTTDAVRIDRIALLEKLRALWFELPDTYAQLVFGELSERVAETVVSQTRHLDPETRAEGCALESFAAYSVELISTTLNTKSSDVCGVTAWWGELRAEGRSS